LPDEFIAMAEETGLIVPIGNQVIEKVCQQYRMWQAAELPVGDLKININISSRQFSSKDFLDKLVAATSAESLASDFIVLEITETALIENVDFANENLSRLRSAGIQIYMDDFGTGYSSLSYLHRFQIDGLKIDRSFVTNMYRQHENMEIIKTIVSLAHNLKMKITAEGIETDEQLLGLGSLHCEFGQGFYLSEPMPASQVSAALENAA
jgi:EAL domain-containing protein (putative c-di-GMP-specific phosphodiesterase class I)